MPFFASFLKNKPKTDPKILVSNSFKSYLLITGMLLAVSSFSSVSAQTVLKKVVHGSTTTPSVTPLKKGVIVQNGVLIQVNGDETKAVKETITFPNGTTVQANGMYTTTDGKNFQLLEGDRVDDRGVMKRNPVKIEEYVTVSGDTTAMGAMLQRAQENQEHLQLLQRKRDLLEQKSKLLDNAAGATAQSNELKKVDADLARVKAQLENPSLDETSSDKKTTTTKKITSKKASSTQKAKSTSSSKQ